jgi:hypothetical protein
LLDQLGVSKLFHATPLSNRTPHQPGRFIGVLAKSGFAADCNLFPRQRFYIHRLIKY